MKSHNYSSFSRHETTIKSCANRFNDHHRKYSYYVICIGTYITYIVLCTLLVRKDNVICTKYLKQVIVF